MVRESFWPGTRAEDVARRSGLTRKQLSAWCSLARRYQLAVSCSWEPALESVPAEPELAPAFATLEVEAASVPEPNPLGSASIEKNNGASRQRHAKRCDGWNRHRW